MATKKTTAAQITKKEKTAEKETEIKVRINKLFDDESSKLRALTTLQTKLTGFFNYAG